MVKIIRKCQNSRLVEGFHSPFDESVVAPLFMPFLAYMGPFLGVRGVAQCALLLALVLVDLQNTCKKKLNRKMLERPNICYIFEKLRVQGYQI